MKHKVPATAAIPPRTQKIRVIPTLLVPYMIVDPLSNIPVPRKAEKLLPAGLGDYIIYGDLLPIILLTTIQKTAVYPNWYGLGGDFVTTLSASFSASAIIARSSASKVISLSTSRTSISKSSRAMVMSSYFDPVLAAGMRYQERNTRLCCKCLECGCLESFHRESEKDSMKGVLQADHRLRI